MVPTYLEQLIHQGRAEFKSYSGFAAQNHIIKVPENTHIIIYEYWYKAQCPFDDFTVSSASANYPSFDFRDTVQYVHFFTGNKYHPFFHKPTLMPTTLAAASTISPNELAPGGEQIVIGSSGIQTDYRKCYIGSSRDISVYFTRLIDANVTYTPVTIGTINSYQVNLGYAGQPVAGRINRFNAGSATHYGPLQQPYSQIGGLTSIDFNQAFTIPNGNGDLTQPETITGSNAQKSNRQLFFHCNYIQVNEPAPKTLI
jgi:hypothetical protein